MSLVNARRGKGRNMYRAADDLVPGSGPGPVRPTKLRSPQECYVCVGKMPIKTVAVWSARRSRWRHSTCDNPQE